jgi:3'-phosphoadenosine 5'-phosphosulfate sulfotransferase (PAPS reductase)/FAD synthetase
MASSKTPQTRIENVISSPSVLDALENESIEIFRETAAAFRKPVMLYSIGKGLFSTTSLSPEGFRPRAYPFPAYAYRHNLEVQGDDFLPR